MDGEYVTTYSNASFYKQFKWDSIFQTTYEILEITEQGDDIIATVTSNSLRYEFLKNNPLICKFKLSFNDGKISRIEALDYVGADWTIWQMKVDSLVAWVNINHPELNGFIHDLSMDGATNYLRAIELYENRNDPL